MRQAAPVYRRPPRSTRTSRVAALALALVVVVLIAWAMMASRGRLGHLTRPVPIAHHAWAKPAAAFAGSQVGSTVRAANLADDPGPPTPSWPTTSGAAWIRTYRGLIVKRVKTSEKVVALTFDDGPDGTTRQVVDILRSRGAHATFFFRGGDLPIGEVAYAVSHGEEIGNHTVSHVALSEQSDATLGREIDGLNTQVYWIVGRRPLWVRARAGSISPRGMAAVEKRGQLYANWNVTADDTNWSISADKITTNVVNSVRPGSIVLLHQTRPDTIKALPAILSQLAAKGYRFVTLSELAALGQP